jgi:hypothetical protein
MDFFIPKDCSIDLVTPYWLLAALALLTVAGVALLAQVVMLWRREVRAGVVRWGRLPLALPILWAIVCGLLAAQAFSYYRDVATPLDCGPVGICSFKGLCFLAADLGVETQFTLVVAAVMVGMGWFALSRFARRIERA